MSNAPNYNVAQYVRATDLTAGGAVSLSSIHDSLQLLFNPGVLNASAASYAFSGLTVTSTLTRPFAVLTGAGALAYPHGTATNADTVVYTTDFTPLVPTSGSAVTAYLVAQISSIQQNPVTIVGPPQGHPSFDPNFVPYTGYQLNVETLALSATTTAPDNVTTFELGRTTLTVGLTTIASMNTTFVSAARPRFLASGETAISATTNYVVQPGAYRLKFRLWGAGGSGGITSDLAFPGGGGGAGGYCEVYLNVTPGQVVPVTVGTGAAAAAGGATAVGGATAGGGAVGGNGVTNVVGIGGAGGTATGGNVNIPGAPGSNGFNFGTSGTVEGGRGACAPHGSGHAFASGGASSGFNANVGTFPGGGSSGCTNSSAAGGNGYVIVEAVAG